MGRVPPARVVALMNNIRNGLGALHRKMAPPEAAMLDFVSGMWGFQIIYVLAELGVADSLDSGPKTADELAEMHGVDAEALYRVLRAATCLGVFKEVGTRRFELNALAETLKTETTGTARAFIVMMGRVGWSHWGHLLDSVKNGKTAIENAHGMQPFEFLGADPEVSEVFNQAMTGASKMSVPPIVSAYDFSRAEHVVDVGGGHGLLIGGILAENERARGVLFDQPHVVDGAEPVLSELGVLDRCTRVGGDFFVSGSVPEGDMHVLKSVIHDWDDDKACEILTNVRQSMPAKGTVLLCEMVVTEPNKTHFSKLLDIEMLVHSGGQERTTDQYGDLLRKAGLRLERVVPTAAPLSIVEAARA